MPPLPFEYHPEAIAESRAAYRWYAERGEEIAEQFWKELVRVRTLVCQQPESGVLYYHASRCFQFHKFPYGLVTIKLSDKIVGLAVCHLHRRPGYWRNRI